VADNGSISIVLAGDHAVVRRGLVRCALDHGLVG
jgi:hypothetical protein